MTPAVSTRVHRSQEQGWQTFGVLRGAGLIHWLWRREGGGGGGAVQRSLCGYVDAPPPPSMHCFAALKHALVYVRPLAIPERLLSGVSEHTP